MDLQKNSCRFISSVIESLDDNGTITPVVGRTSPKIVLTDTTNRLKATVSVFKKLKKNGNRVRGILQNAYGRQEYPGKK